MGWQLRLLGQMGTHASSLLCGHGFGYLAILEERDKTTTMSQCHSAIYIPSTNQLAGWFGRGSALPCPHLTLLRTQETDKTTIQPGLFAFV
jgi:hypothetical protein